jgi:hypothetical protein
MKQVDINSRWSDSQFKDRRVKVSDIVNEDNMTLVYYGMHGADTTYVAEISEFLQRFKSINSNE